MVWVKHPIGIGPTEMHKVMNMALLLSCWNSDWQKLLITFFCGSVDNPCKQNGSTSRPTEYPSNCLTLRWNSRKNFSQKVHFEKSARGQMKDFPAYSKSCLKQQLKKNTKNWFSISIIA